MSAPVGGRVGARTDVWRDLAYELGDYWADRCCAWADRCEDPAEAAAALLAVLALREERLSGVPAAVAFMRGADEAVWLAVKRDFEVWRRPRWEG